jgi:hypothetical protein
MKSYVYIYFEKEINVDRKTGVWFCRNRKSKSILGTVSWYPAWRQYCFFPNGGMVFSAGCLDDIADFIKTQMEAKRAA